MYCANNHQNHLISIGSFAVLSNSSDLSSKMPLGLEISLNWAVQRYVSRLCSLNQINYLRIDIKAIKRRMYWVYSWELCTSTYYSASVWPSIRDNALDTSSIVQPFLVDIKNSPPITLVLGGRSSYKKLRKTARLIRINISFSFSLYLR